MKQWKQRAYVDEFGTYDGDFACIFDPFELTTYVGRHITSCWINMEGERYGASVVWKGSNYDMKDLNVLHTEALAKNLRESVDYAVFEYNEAAVVQEVRFSVIDSHELREVGRERAAYSTRYRLDSCGKRLGLYATVWFNHAKKTFEVEGGWKNLHDEITLHLNRELSRKGYSFCEVGAMDEVE